MRAVAVIPAFNEAATVRDIVVRTLAHCPQVIVVDDGSTDATAACLEGLPVELLRHAVNRGKAASLRDGFAAALAAGAEVVVTLDGDGQHRPEDIPRLLAAGALNPGRIVIGARVRNRGAAPMSRRIANAAADFWLSWAAGYPIVDTQSGQRVYPAALLRELSAVAVERGAGFAFESELLLVAAQRGFRAVAVPIETLYFPDARPSHFRPARDIARIGGVVARHLIAARFNPRGLWRALTQAPELIDGTPCRGERGSDGPAGSGGSGRAYNRGRRAARLRPPP